MTDPAYTHFAILADRTGSMGTRADPGSEITRATLTTRGIHDLIHEQAAHPGRTTFSLVQFDSQGIDRVASFVPASDPRLASWKVMPRAMTPLLDAIGQEITRTGQELADLPEDARPGRVFFVIGTDGAENASREYTRQQIADMVTRQREAYGWEFVFIGADIDAFAEAGGVGVASGSTLLANSANLAAAYRGTSEAVSRSRVSGQSVSYTDEERERARGRQ